MSSFIFSFKLSLYLISFLSQTTAGIEEHSSNFFVELYSLCISVANCILMSTVLLLKKSSISHYDTVLEVLQPYILTTAGQNIDRFIF